MDSCVPDTKTEAKPASASANRRLRRSFLFLLPFLPGANQAAYNFNFPEPVTPIARETLHIHNEFMLIITLLFVVVFAIMIYSMIRHRKSIGHQRPYLENAMVLDVRSLCHLALHRLHPDGHPGGRGHR